ncbi:MAG: LytTR family transcriptional regulator DNA-binding domain-containing protein [Salibacteraceae bacterium]|nr:LytTR family transcriptional regulator DNA-binding domain-containing protein [Salibacteraceae bacterium]
MIKTLLIDDEPLACAVVEEYLSAHPDFEIIGKCHDGFQGAKMIQELKPDLVFLDVQMPKISGLEMLELLDEIPSVIFTTAFEEYALKAFDANAVDYLLKPFSQERFDAALLRFKATNQHNKTQIEKLVGAQAVNRIVLKDNGRIRIIPLEDVLVLEADDDYVKIKTAEQTFMKKITLSHYENHLPETRFVRIHRSYMINVAEVTRIEPYEKTSHIAITKSGLKLPVSKSGYQKLKEVLGI